MHKTLADLIIEQNVEWFPLEKGPTQTLDADRSASVIATNGPVSILHVPYNLPVLTEFTDNKNRVIPRFVSGPDTMDLYVLGEHRAAMGHGHRMYVRGFVPDTSFIEKHDNGSLALAAYVAPENMKQFVDQFTQPLNEAKLSGVLGDYIFGPTNSPSLDRTAPTAMSLSIPEVSVDRAIKRAVRNNPGLRPFEGALDMVYFRAPPVPREEKD